MAWRRSAPASLVLKATARCPGRYRPLRTMAVPRRCNTSGSANTTRRSESPARTRRGHCLDDEDRPPTSSPPLADPGRCWANSSSFLRPPSILKSGVTLPEKVSQPSSRPRSLPTCRRGGRLRRRTRRISRPSAAIAADDARWSPARTRQWTRRGEGGPGIGRRGYLRRSPI